MSECKYRDCKLDAVHKGFCSPSHKTQYYRDKRGNKVTLPTVTPVNVTPVTPSIVTPESVTPAATVTPDVLPPAPAEHKGIKAMA